MKKKSYAILAIVGLLMAAFAYITPAVADDMGDQFMQPTSDTDNSMPASGNTLQNNNSSTDNNATNNQDNSSNSNVGSGTDDTTSLDKATGDDDY